MMMMNTQIALAILAWLDAVEGRALPQPQIGTVTAASIPGVATASAGIVVAKPTPDSILPPLPAVPVPVSGQGLGGAALLAPVLPKPAAQPVPLAIPNLASDLPKLPVTDDLSVGVSTLLPLETTLVPFPKLPLDIATLPKPSVSVPSLGDLPVAAKPLPSPPLSLPAIENLPLASVTKLSLPPLASLNVPLPVLNVLLPKVPLPDLTVPKVPPPELTFPKAPLPKAPLTDITIPKVPLPDVSLPDLTAGDPESVADFVKLGKSVFGTILSILAHAVKVPTPDAPAVPIGKSTKSATPLLGKRQISALAAAATSTKPATAPSATAAIGGVSSGLVGGLPVVGGLTSSLPVVGGLTSSVPVSDPLNTVANTAGTVGGVVSGSPVGGVAGTVANTVGSLPVVGGVTAPIANTVGGLTAPPLGLTTPPPPPVGSTFSGFPGGLPGPWPLSSGIPGTDPVGSVSISIIATLLSLLKKDPLSLFGGLGGTGGLLKRDIPELADAFEIEKRQLANLPSLSTGISGIGVGGLPLSGVPGVSPDIAFLVGSIAKNIAVPGGKGLGSVTGNILSVLNGVVPNFLFKLPVVQDSVPTFGVLQLLSSINPVKFGSLADLTTLAALSQAANSIPPGDLAFIRTLPLSPDPNNLITTITTLSDNILSLPGNVINLKASVSVLCLRNLGLSVPGL